MKAQLIGKNNRGPALSLSNGFATLEILIAFAMIILSMGAVVLLAFGNQSVAIDSETNNEALYKAEAMLEEARVVSRKKFISLTSKTDTETSGLLTYTKVLTIEDTTPCKKLATGVVSWNLISRTQKIELSTYLSDIPGARDLGGDCPSDPGEGGWEHPQRFASDTLNPGKTTTIDVLDRIAYIGADKKPFLYIADTRSAVLGQTSGMIIGIPTNKFNNLFNDDGKSIDTINDVDVYKDNTTGRVYTLLALASSTAQFGIVDVTDINNPDLLATRRLNGITATDITSHGYRIYYFDKKAFIVSRETAGPEFHIFDISTPSNPIELGHGTSLIGPTPPNGTTVNDLTVRNDVVFFAAEKEAAELLVYDISIPGAPVFMPGATVDLPGSKDGFSIFHSGSRLYFGREKSTGPELYVFDASNPHGAVGGLPILGTPEEIDAGVLDLYTIGRFGFLVTDKTNQEFQVWNIKDVLDIKNIAKYNFGNIVAGGVDYEPDFIYATGDATPNFQILYSP